MPNVTSTALNSLAERPSPTGMTLLTVSTHVTGPSPQTALPTSSNSKAFSVMTPTGTALREAQTGAPLMSTVISAAVIAALVAASVNLFVAVWAARRKTREEDRARVRASLSAAYQAYADYKEFAYAIPRRDPSSPEAERVRISEALREVQSRLSYHLTWTMTEDPRLGDRYAELVHQARIVAGSAMREGWNRSPVANDSEMNIGPELVDLSPLLPYERSFMNAARAHVERSGHKH